MSSSNTQSIADRVKPSMQATWRVLVAMVLVQPLGAALGWRWAPVGDTFLDLWYGAAFTLPFGFLLGPLWQRRAARDTLARHRWPIVGYELFSVVVPLYGVLTYDIWRAAAVL